MSAVISTDAAHGTISAQRTSRRPGNRALSNCARARESSIVTVDHARPPRSGCAVSTPAGPARRTVGVVARRPRSPGSSPVELMSCREVRTISTTGQTTTARISTSRGAEPQQRLQRPQPRGPAAGGASPAAPVPGPSRPRRCARGDVLHGRPSAVLLRGLLDLARGPLRAPCSTRRCRCAASPRPRRSPRPGCRWGANSRAGQGVDERLVVGGSDSARHRPTRSPAGSPRWSGTSRRSPSGRRSRGTSSPPPGSCPSFFLNATR